MNTFPKPRLQSLIFEVTPRCNHACLHCYNFWNAPDAAPEAFPREAGTERTLALLAKALDESDCQHVTLTGGEPLLRSDLPQIVDFLRARGVPSTLISNGRLLNEASVVDLLERGVGLFELPLLSHRRAVHDELSAVAGAWDAVLAAMAHVRYHRGQFVAVFVATRRNLPDLYETLRLAFAFGARAVMFNRFNPGGRGIAHLEALLPSAAELRSALQIANAAAAEFSLPIACSIPIQPCLVDLKAYPNLGFGFCAAGTSRAYYTLDTAGNLRPCNHTPTILGNLFDEPFERLVAAERMAPFNRAIPACCLECAQREACQGGCKAAAQVCYGSLQAEEPFLRYNLPVQST